MTPQWTAWIRSLPAWTVGAWLSACGPGDAPRTDSQTNWLRTCETDSQCEGLQCVCGFCSRPCGSAAQCADLVGASCISSDETSAVAVCGGRIPSTDGICLPRCDDGGCTSGQMCVAGACSLLPEPTVHVAVAPSLLHQSLTGFGATLAYVEDAVTTHPEKSALFQALFSDLGLDILRLRNRYGYEGDDDLSTASEIVSAAGDSLGRPPTIMLSSWSPPAALKASGSALCQGDAETCTLIQLPSGAFDYAGFAAHWLSSLQAYADVGIVPDYVGLQNNPDFVPPAWTPGEGCRFLPTEGTTTEWVDGAEVRVDYPGFAEALDAVLDQLAALSSPPKIAAPEASTLASVADYTAELDLSQVDAIAHHLYGTDPEAIDRDALEALSELGRDAALPLFQTEMESDGLGTAVLMHYALAVEGASAYLHSVLVRPDAMPTATTGTLVSLGDEGFTLEAPYHAMRHFAYYTDPGWSRAEATSDAQELLASAWVSPDNDALTIVLVNAGATDLATQIDLGEPVTMSSTVTRTVFEGVERSADLGTLSPEGIVRVPRHAILTVALHE